MNGFCVRYYGSTKVKMIRNEGKYFWMVVKL